MLHVASRVSLPAQRRSPEWEDLATRALVALDERSPRDVDAVHATLLEVFVEHGLARYLEPPRLWGRRRGLSHGLCGLLADLAHAFDELGELPASAGRLVDEYGHQAGWSAEKGVVASAVVRRLGGLVLSPALSPLAGVVTQVRMGALLFCPDPNGHPGLGRSCAQDVLNALGLPGELPGSPE